MGPLCLGDRSVSLPASTFYLPHFFSVIMLSGFWFIVKVEHFEEMFLMLWSVTAYCASQQVSYLALCLGNENISFRKQSPFIFPNSFPSWSQFINSLRWQALVIILNNVLNLSSHAGQACWLVFLALSLLHVITLRVIFCLARLLSITLWKVLERWKW